MVWLTGALALLASGCAGPGAPPDWPAVVEQVLREPRFQGTQRPARIVLVGTGWDDARAIHGIVPGRADSLQHLPDGGVIASPCVLVLVSRADLDAGPRGQWWSGEPIPLSGDDGEWVLVQAPQGIP